MSAWVAFGVDVGPRGLGARRRDCIVVRLGDSVKALTLLATAAFATRLAVGPHKRQQGMWGRAVAAQARGPQRPVILVVTPLPSTICGGPPLASEGLLGSPGWSAECTG